MDSHLETIAKYRLWISALTEHSARLAHLRVLDVDGLIPLIPRVCRQPHGQQVVVLTPDPGHLQTHHLVVKRMRHYYKHLYKHLVRTLTFTKLFNLDPKYCLILFITLLHFNCKFSTLFKALRILI